jgi:hypothetical protein
MAGADFGRRVDVAKSGALANSFAADRPSIEERLAAGKATATGMPPSSTPANAATARERRIDRPDFRTSAIGYARRCQHTPSVAAAYLTMHLKPT